MRHRWTLRRNGVSSAEAASQRAADCICPLFVGDGIQALQIKPELSRRCPPFSGTGLYGSFRKIILPAPEKARDIPKRSF